LQLDLLLDSSQISSSICFFVSKNHSTNFAMQIGSPVAICNLLKKEEVTAGFVLNSRQYDEPSALTGQCQGEYDEEAAIASVVEVETKPRFLTTVLDWKNLRCGATKDGRSLLRSAVLKRKSMDSRERQCRSTPENTSEEHKLSEAKFRTIIDT